MQLRILLFCICVFCFSCGNKKVELKTDSGQLKERYSVNKNNEKDGIYESWFDNGQLFEKSEYKNGILTGLRTIFYPNGQPEVTEMYNDKGELHGMYRTYYDDGTLKAEKTYVNNVLQGIVKTYHPNGKLKEEVIFTDNMENGPFTEYHPNGVVQWKGTYLNGDNEFGILEEFDSTGVLLKKMMCDSQAVCRTFWKVGMPVTQ